jgi:adenine C2-methylase RlmN of 23S rRNA A2503 and tRNA A37
VSPDGAPRLQDTRTNLVGLSREALTAALVEYGEKPFRAKQVWHWIYHRGAAGRHGAFSDKVGPGLATKMRPNP